MSVNINDINAKTTDAKAKQKGEAFAKEFAAAITSLKIEPRLQSAASMSQVAELAASARSAIMARFEMTSPRNAFMFALGSPFGGVRAYIPWEQASMSYPTYNWMAEFPVEKPNDMFRINWRKTSMHGDGPIWGPDGIVVIPVSKLFTLRGGDEHKFTFQAFTQRSDTKGREKFVEVYVTQEAGAKIGLGALPGIGAVFSYDIKAGEKIGEKKSHKWEESTSTRVGRQLSRTFVLEKLGRNCIVIRENMLLEIPLIAQYASRIQFKEGGDPAGPFWGPIQTLGTEDDSEAAYDAAAAFLETLIGQAALEVAQRAGRLQPA